MLVFCWIFCNSNINGQSQHICNSYHLVSLIWEKALANKCNHFNGCNLQTHKIIFSFFNGTNSFIWTQFGITVISLLIHLIFSLIRFARYIDGA